MSGISIPIHCSSTSKAVIFGSNKIHASRASSILVSTPEILLHLFSKGAPERTGFRIPESLTWGITTILIFMHSFGVGDSVESQAAMDAMTELFLPITTSWAAIVGASFGVNATNSVKGK